MFPKRNYQTYFLIDFHFSFLKARVLRQFPQVTPRLVLATSPKSSHAGRFFLKQLPTGTPPLCPSPSAVWEKIGTKCLVCFFFILIPSQISIFNIESDCVVVGYLLNPNLVSLVVHKPTNSQQALGVEVVAIDPQHL